MYSVHLLCCLEWRMIHCHYGILQKGVNGRVGSLLANVSVPFVRLCLHVHRYLNSVCVYQTVLPCGSSSGYSVLASWIIREQQNIFHTGCVPAHSSTGGGGFFFKSGSGHSDAYNLLPFHMESSQKCLKGTRAHSSKSFPAWVWVEREQHEQNIWPSLPSMFAEFIGRNLWNIWTRSPIDSICQCGCFYCKHHDVFIAVLLPDSVPTVYPWWPFRPSCVSCLQRCCHLSLCKA